MGHAKRNKLVFTEKDKCRVCFTCVRECPVKAIKIINGQAEVLSERCIGCGNCVSVCSQKAKVVLDLKSEVEILLQTKEAPVFALLAPSFPAEFTDINDYRILTGMLRKLGFEKVFDVAFGADLVARKYNQLLEDNSEQTYISSDCPAVVFYVEHFHPDLVNRIAPIVSPMVATARLIKETYGNNVKTVFIGPCFAKKAESDEIDVALTFKELRELFAKYSINESEVEAGEFDGPESAMGSIFPVTRGLSQNLKKNDNIAEGNVIVDSGKHNFKEAIKEFERGEISNYNLELLCCEGCILGPGMSEKNKYFFKRSQISKYVKEKMNKIDIQKWNENISKYNHLDLSQTFSPLDRRISDPEQEEIQQVLARMGKIKTSDYLNCGACGYETCYEHAISVVQGYAESEMCLPYTIEKLHKYVDDLNDSNEKLKNTKLALKHSEKLANMGQISAGIAHELNNPLGVITMYSNIILDELKSEDPLRKDVALIVEQAHRCKGIVSGLLNFARKNKIKVQEVDIVEFLQHSLNSVVIPANIKTSVNSGISDPFLMIDPDQMIQVFTNIEKNAIEAMPEGGEINIFINGDDKHVEINICDTGSGIPEENMDKLFTPFFTTKEIGKGTGLGLPLVYGIIKMHSGKISVKSNSNPKMGPTGTEFKITLPRIN
ncbi:MAG: 4Fe-4S dicluster domain-containing protein [Bacteroidetes bacterium]|nr:4Fe-4S dicluster domain-containing protein [Bacteroidota bacterium]